MQETVGEKIYTFADFEIDADRRLLLKNGESVMLKAKAFDVLLALVARHGEVLSKDELLETVWKDSFVEENNLTVHISALRKIFGETKNENQFIATVPGKGYKFVAEIQAANGEKALPIRAELPTSAFYEAETLVGREREIAEIINLLRGDTTNLITLTGTGGTGKTRIARAIADEAAADFPDGIFFVELAAVSDAKLVAAAIANALGVKESGGADLFETLKNFLRERRALLILDNFEQLISAAPLVNEISAASSLLKILTTSRVALATKNEREFAVTPLAVPPREAAISADKFAGYAAVALFIRRAQSAKPNFVLTDENAPFVAGICHRLDGLPLAIELAAARIKLLSAQAIFDRLENSLKLLTRSDKNLPSRQRTMRETIQWSYDLLDADEKVMFRRLAVFVGGFSIEAAEAVVSGAERWSAVGENLAESGIDAATANDNQPLTTDHRQLPTVLDIITSLVESNLLAHKEQADGNTRLRMLEVVREFAAECLEAGDEQNALEQNHAKFFLALAEEAEPHLTGEQAVEWLEKLEIEIDNLRAALRRTLKTDTKTTIRMAGALRYLWIYHSHLTEGGDWLKAALELSDEAPPALRFKLLHGLGLVKRIQGDYEAARKLYERALDEGTAAGDKRQIALTYSGLGAILHSQGDVAAARKYFEDGLAISRELNDDFSIAYALTCLGIFAGIDGKPAEARRLLEESLSIQRRIGSKESVSNNLNNLGAVAFDEGDYEAAHVYFAEGLELSHEVGNKVNITDALNGFAALAEQRREPELAAKLAGAAENLGQSIGYNKEPTERLFCETYIAKIRAALDEKSFASAFEQGQAMDLSEAIALARFQSLEKSFKNVSRNLRTELITGFAAQPTDIVVENISFSRVVIEEELSENESRKGQISVGKILLSKKLLAAIILGLLLIGLSGFGLYQKYGSRQMFSGAWNDSALSVIEPRQITANGKIDYAALSPDGNYFAYVVAEAEEQSLWFGQTNGSQKMQIRPPEKVKYYGLTFAPNGNQIYYAAGGRENPNGALYRITTMGGAPQKVLEKIKTPVAFSPDGKQIAFARFDEERKLSVLIAADAESGANEREITSRPSENAFSQNGAAWSPDGNLIAVGAGKGNPDLGEEILLVNAADGKTEAFGAGNWNSVRRAAWLKDGSGLLVNVIEKDNWDDRHVWLLEYPSGQARKITRDVYRYAAASVGVSDDNSKILVLREQSLSNVFVGEASDLNQSKQITSNSMGKRDGVRGLAWTPDGNLIFSQFFDKSQTLWTMDADGANTRQITPPGFLDRHISVSKDGRQIFFDSMRNGVWNIWRVTLEGGDLRQITTVGGVRPVASPDGKWIFYTGNFANGYDSIWKIPSEGGEPVKVVEQSSDWTSIAPDGTRFACVTRPRGEKSRLAIFPIEGGAPLAEFDLDVGRDFGDIRWTSDGQSLVYRSTALWRQSLAGGKAEKILEFPGEIIFAFDFSPDGKRFAVTRGERARDVVLIENTLK